MNQIIDAKGWECPKPIIETKKMLDTMKEGSVTTIVDNQIAVDNLISFADSLGYQVENEQKGELFYVKVTKAYSEEDAVFAQAKDLVIQISTKQYGSGEEELGESLMKAYIYSLTEVSPKPKTLMFVNKGVFLTTEGSDVLDSLHALKEEGVEILSCGACLNFYHLTEQLKVGGVTNMYTMTEKLNHAGNGLKI